MEITKPAAIALFAASAASCGLFPSESPPSSSIPSDGISSFGDASPIEICLGSARVVPALMPGAGAGVCVRKGATSPSCADDSTCVGHERCICGRCVVEACEGVSSCSLGQVCRGKRCTTACSDDLPCPSGERCVSGGCARPCSTDAACSFGERCDPLDGACSTKLCGGALTCGPSDTCELERVAGDIHEPSLPQPSDSSIAFFEIRNGGIGVTDGIYRARIDALSRWTADPPEPVLAPLSGEISVGSPSARVITGGAGGSIDLYFDVNDGAFITHASSSDGGLTFQRAPLPTLEPAEPWEFGRVASPSVVEYNGGLYLFYEGGPRAGIGLARIDTATGAATRLAQIPIASPASVEDPIFWRSITEVGSPDAIAVSGVLRLYFSARGAEAGDALSAEGAIPGDINDSIGLLTTRDLTTFDPYPTGPVLARVTNLRGYLGEREPAAFVSTSGASLTFLATDASGKTQSGLARAASR